MQQQYARKNCNYFIYKQKIQNNNKIYEKKEFNKTIRSSTHFTRIMPGKQTQTHRAQKKTFNLIQKGPLFKSNRLKHNDDRFLFRLQSIENYVVL